MCESVEEFLQKCIDSYTPQRSKDPYENECLNCNITEIQHEKGYYINNERIDCGNFR